MTCSPFHCRFRSVTSSRRARAVLREVLLRVLAPDPHQPLVVLAEQAAVLRDRVPLELLVADRRLVEERAEEGRVLAADRPDVVLDVRPPPGSSSARRSPGCRSRGGSRPRRRESSPPRGWRRTCRRGASSGTGSCKFPTYFWNWLRNAAGQSGVVPRRTSFSRSWLFPSYEAKKWSLSFTIGPPMLTPGCQRVYSGFGLEPPVSACLRDTVLETRFLFW